MPNLPVKPHVFRAHVTTGHVSCIYCHASKCDLTLPGGKYAQCSQRNAFALPVNQLPARTPEAHALGLYVNYDHADRLRLRAMGVAADA